MAKILGGGEGGVKNNWRCEGEKLTTAKIFVYIR